MFPYEKSNKKTFTVTRNCGILFVFFFVLQLLVFIAFLLTFQYPFSDNDKSSGVYENTVHHKDTVLPSKPAIKSINGEIFEYTKYVYVIPGGGTIKSNTSFYPEWTRRRTQAAFEHYQERNKNDAEVLFIALSAGSMNAPNRLRDDGRIRLECHHTIDHLRKLGIPSNRIYGDMFSWDTVTNGLSLRLFLEGIISYQPQLLAPINTESPSKTSTAGPVGDKRANKLKRKKHKEAERSTEDLFFTDDFEGKSIPSLSATRKLTTWQESRPEEQTRKDLLGAKNNNKISVEVFISDFHAERVRAAFEWILELQPSLMPSIALTIHPVTSTGIGWGSENQFQDRLVHERAGLVQLQANRKAIRTVSHFFSFLMLGGHKGLARYINGGYTPTEGAGWS